jgi:hypothetical protein
VGITGWRADPERSEGEGEASPVHAVLGRPCLEIRAEAIPQVNVLLR